MKTIDETFDTVERVIERMTKLVELLHPLVVHVALLVLAIIGVVALVKSHHN